MKLSTGVGDPSAHSNLPVKEKNNKEINWNDEWFLERLNAGFPDRKKLAKNSSQKK